MGIPGFNTWFKKSFAEAYVNLSQLNVDHLYIDMNSVLHLVLRRARNMNQFYFLLFRKCDTILNTCRPRKSIMFALDGPAPVAKLLTQRIRRKRVPLSPSDAKGQTVSPLALTPGTPFMQELHEAMSYYICQRLVGSKWKNLRMELSGSTVQGEGECKMLARLQRPLDHVLPIDSHVLIGNDSDLLVMSLVANCNRLYVLGQITDYRQDLSQSPRNLKIFSVEKLKKPLSDLVTSRKLPSHEVKSHLKAIRRDLAITCILSRGNDYLPSVGGVSLDRSEENYDGVKRDNGLWGVYLQLKNTKKYGMRSLALQKNGQTQLDYEFLYDLLKESGIKTVNRRIAESKREPDAHLYLDGLKWILDMYSKGICPDYRYVYDGMGPSSQELCDAIMERQQATEPLTMMSSQSKRLPLRPSECALALLPYHAQRYVPKPLQHLMEPDSPIGDLFEVCKECAEISERTSALQRDLAANAAQTVELKERMLGMDENQQMKLQQKVDALEAKREQLREKMREISSEREIHMNEKHPYQPFPVDRIEKAVKNLPVTEFSVQDNALFSFGESYVFERLKHRPRVSSSSPRLIRIVKDAPEPPSDKFKKFKMPLPIVRGSYPSDSMRVRTFSLNARRCLSLLRRLHL